MPVLSTAAPTTETTESESLRPVPIFPSLLVLPSSHVDPDIPFEVASTLGSIFTVFAVFVTIVVENVWVEGFPDSAYALEERKTSAAPGAGTVT
jgi:hypothetical protein